MAVVLPGSPSPQPGTQACSDLSQEPHHPLFPPAPAAVWLAVSLYPLCYIQGPLEASPLNYAITERGRISRSSIQFTHFTMEETHAKRYGCAYDLTAGLGPPGFFFFNYARTIRLSY